jgi:two-component system LytT family response regulator
MINAIVVDDENSAIVTLKNDLLTYCPMVNVTHCFTKASEAITYLDTHTPDVIFLDIDMPVMNGFDFLQALKKPIQAQIIFVTAYSEFAIKAFKVSALDYLLKPIDPSELVSAVQKILIKKEHNQDQNVLFKNFIDNYTSDSPRVKIALPVNDGYHLIDPNHVIYCKADGAYTEIIMENEKSFLISKTLGRTQELMPPAFFERVHQSYLINLNHIKKFRKGESPVAIMANNDVVKVSRLNKDKLASRLGLSK